MRRHFRAEGGQAAVETAITAPLFIFMVLGMIQFTLLYQAKAMLKYAAYRAVRVGAMQQGCRDKMTAAAVGALLPVIGWGDKLLPTDSVAHYGESFLKVKLLGFKYLNPPSLPIAEVRICGPLSGWFGDNTMKIDKDVDFDDPFNVWTGGDSSGMEGWERMRLRIQVRYYHKLIIPFANWVVFRTWMGQSMIDVLRMGAKGPGGIPMQAKTLGYDFGAQKGYRPTAEAENKALLLLGQQQHQYYIPLYANYAFRMQSNIDLNKCPMPDQNECWHYPTAANGDPKPGTP
jgi:hypothetical protein